MGGPSETRSDRLAVRLNVGKRYACPDVRRRVSEGPPVSPALHAALGPRSRASKDSRGIPTITADLKPACRRKLGHAISSGRTREPGHSSPKSDLEHRGEGGRGGGGLGKPVVVRRDRRTGNRQAGGGPDSPIGFPKAPPAPPPPWIGGDWVATVSN